MANVRLNQWQDSTGIAAELLFRGRAGWRRPAARTENGSGAAAGLHYEQCEQHVGHNEKQQPYLPRFHHFYYASNAHVIVKSRRGLAE